MEKMHKATLAEKLGYGLGELPGTMNSILGAVLTMFYTDSAGLAAGMVGWILALTGYVANEVQNSATVFGISFMFAWLPVILLAFVILSFKFVYKYDEEEPEVLAELARRKEKNGSEQ